MARIDRGRIMMVDLEILEKEYPLTTKFLREHPGMTLDDAVEYFQRLHTIQ
jgi:hypothetical protein